MRFDFLSYDRFNFYYDGRRNTLETVIRNNFLVLRIYLIETLSERGIYLRTEKEVLSQFTKWAEENELIRAAVLTSSRVNPESNIDFLSDYDIELYVANLNPFKQNDDWLHVFGSIMVRWPFKPCSTSHQDWITRLVLFKDGVRIDFQITDQYEIQANDYENGYKVLIDKDSILAELDKPTYSKYIIKKPSKEEYVTLVHEFWWDAIYVPKYLWRDELSFAKYMLDYTIRYSFLHKVIEWYIGLQNNWSVNPGLCGIKFKSYLSEEIWLEFKSTYAGSGIEENWVAFFNTVQLFRKLAKKIASDLNYSYPNEMDKEVTQYCIEIKETKCPSRDFE